MDNVEDLICKVKEANSTKFVELARLAGLDPTSAFRFANLEGVDFSNQDLRGFDFTGALLNGCSFRNANVRGAIFTNAELDERALSEASDYQDLRTVTQLPGMRDPQKTKRAILDAATDEFVAKGFAGASVNEIADRANVNKRMLYHYYGKKDELYVGVLIDLKNQYIGELERLPLNKLLPPTAIQELIKFTWEYFAQNHNFVELIVLQNFSDKKRSAHADVIEHANLDANKILEDIVRRGEVAGFFRKHVDTERLYISIAALCVIHRRPKIIADLILGYLCSPTEG